MFSEALSPKILTKPALDQFLAKGWFRMGQTIFTTNFLNFHGAFYSAVWLRADLSNYLMEPKMANKFKALLPFNVEIRPAFLTEEKEALFELYKTSVSFEASSSLTNLLYGKEDYTIYDTYEIVVYDEDKLIACGFFDIGNESAEGISSFYDPSYKKYSLGKFLIYSKMNYCQSIGLKYFYAGYFVPNYPSFDYKLTIGAASLEYFDCIQECWKPISDFVATKSPLSIMHDKISEFNQALLSNGIESYLFYYEFYNANLVPEFKEMAALLDFPLFIYLYDLEDVSVNPIIVYDVKSDLYKILSCGTFYKVDAVLTSDKNYTSRILTVENTIFESNDLNKLISVVEKLRQNSSII